MNQEQEEIEILRDLIKQKDKQLDAYRKQVQFKSIQIEQLKQAVKTYTEASERLSEIGMNPMDYPVTYEGSLSE